MAGQSDLILDPFPHLVIPNVLPAEIYEDMLSIMPSSEEWLASAREMTPRDENEVLEENLVQPMLALREGSYSSLPVEAYPAWKKYWGLFAELDARLIEEFRALIPDQVKIGSSVLTERTRGWHIGPHLHDQRQVIQSMLYMPHPGSSEDAGTILYRLKGSPRDVSQMKADDSDKGSFAAIMTFEEDEVEEAAVLPYRPNTLVAFLNTPVSVHAAPKTSERRRYVFSCCVKWTG